MFMRCSAWYRALTLLVEAQQTNDGALEHELLSLLHASWGVSNTERRDVRAVDFATNSCAQAICPLEM